MKDAGAVRRIVILIRLSETFGRVQVSRDPNYHCSSDMIIQIALSLRLAGDPLPLPAANQASP